MSRTYKPFSGPFAPMLTEFLAHWTEDGKMLKKIRGRANLSIRFDGR